MHWGSALSAERSMEAFSTMQGRVVASFAIGQSTLCGRFVDELSRKTGIFRALRGLEEADFLCSRDCVAERKGFEPSVQV
jgi:hypothetical protein